MDEGGQGLMALFGPSAAAARLFERFQGRKPDRDEILDVALRKPDVALVVGELQGVIYKASGDGKRYIHRFHKRDRPVLAVSHDGSQIYVLAGGYSFTDRGFVDK